MLFLISGTQGQGVIIHSPILRFLFNAPAPPKGCSACWRAIGVARHRFIHSSESAGLERAIITLRVLVDIGTASDRRSDLCCALAKIDRSIYLLFFFFSGRYDILCGEAISPRPRGRTKGQSSPGAERATLQICHRKIRTARGKIEKSFEGISQAADLMSI